MYSRSKGRAVCELFAFSHSCMADADGEGQGNMLPCFCLGMLSSGSLLIPHHGFTLRKCGDVVGACFGPVLHITCSGVLQ